MQFHQRQKLNLLSLNLSYNCIGNVAVHDLAEMITGKDCVIENLKLKCCFLKKEEFEVLISAVNNLKTLQVLDLSSNRFTGLTLDITAIISNNVNLENLDISCCDLQEIVTRLKPLCLKDLNLDGNNLSTSVSIKRLISKRCGLHTLSLSNCKLHKTTLMKVLKKIKLSLKHLNLTDNKVSDSAAKSLQIVLNDNNKLEHLNLSNVDCKKRDLYVY